MKKNIFKILLDNIISILLFFILGFLLGFFITEIGYNSNFSYYQITIKSDQDINNLFTYDYFDNTINYINNYNNNLKEGEKKISYADVDYKSMLASIEVILEDDVYKVNIKSKYFPTTIKSANGQLNHGEDRCFKYISLILSYSNYKIEYLGESKTILYNYINPYLVGSVVSIVIGISYLVFLLTISYKIEEKESIYDNKYLFKFPFSKLYWKYSKESFKTIKSLCVISILFALMIICKMIVLPSGFGALGISFTYLVFSVIAMINGPICGLIVGMFSNLLGYFLFQSGTTFFFGYTLSSMITGFIYGIFFYRTKITFMKCLYARIIVNLFVNVILGSLWWAIINKLNTDAFNSYLFVIALPKNLLYLLPQSILLFIVLKSLSRPMSSFGLIDERISENCTII